MLRVVACIVVALLLLGSGKLYIRDAATVTRALAVEAYLEEHCRAHGQYPPHEALAARFPELAPGNEWYYWPNETRTAATFQYPMSLPLPAAPGRSKLSEFVPLIYAYAVRNPCEGLVPQAASAAGG